MGGGLPGDEDDGLMGEINVTPVVDVFLVLLLVFMITAPLLSVAIDVDLPELASGSAKSAPALVVDLGAEGTVAIGDRIVLLEEVVAAARKNDGGGFREVHLRADRVVEFGRVISVLDALRLSGVSEVSLMGESMPEVEVDGP